MTTLVNCFKAEDKFVMQLNGKSEEVYCGPCPFTVVRDSQEAKDRFYKMPWVIKFKGKAIDKLFKVIRVESYCTTTTFEGQSIGLIFEELK